MRIGMLRIIYMANVSRYYRFFDDLTYCDKVKVLEDHQFRYQEEKIFSVSAKVQITKQQIFRLSFSTEQCCVFHILVCY